MSVHGRVVRYLTKVNVAFDAWDPKSCRGAIEFARQLSSRRLQKINPKLEVECKVLEHPSPSRIHLAFIDGSEKFIDPTNRSVEKMLEEIVWKCNELQTVLEDKGQGVEDDDE